MVLPETIQPYVPTTLAWGNTDRLEGTLSGEGPSHRVNGIAVQTSVSGPQLPEKEFRVQKGAKVLLQLIITMLENYLVFHLGHTQ